MIINYVSIVTIDEICWNSKVINSDQSLTTNNISNLFLNFVAAGVDNAHVHNTQSFH